MAQVWTAKQQGWIQRFDNAVISLMTAADALQPLVNEFTDDTYGSGGTNQLTDAVVQAILPAATAAIVDSAEGAVVTILATISTNRGYLENIRP